MDQEEQLLIGELAKRAGVTPRTIRYYTSEGLLPPPTTRGKYAYYSDEHLRRLRLIARLKEEYLPLSAIRGRLATMSAAEADRLLGKGSEVQGSQMPGLVSRSGEAPPTGQGASGVLAERPASYRLPRGAEWAGRAPGAAELMAGSLSDPFRLTPGQLPLGRVEFFPAAPEGVEAAEQEQPPSAAREEIWRHYTLAPGAELRVREPLSSRRRRQIEELLAAMRDKLLSEEE